MRAPGTIRYRFGPFEVDLRSRVLYHGQDPVALAPRTVDTLIALLDRAGQVASREDLMGAIWPDRVVEEVNLTQHISLLRRALAAREGAVEYVRNFPGRGYQFVHPVEPVGEPAPARSRRFPVAWIAAALAAAVFLPFALRSFMHPEPAPLRRLPLSRLPGSKWHPALSPDGTRIAFVWDQSGGQPCLWIKREDHEEPSQVPGSCGSPGSPVFSPDGLRVAYLRHRPAATELVIWSDVSSDERIVARLYPVRSLIGNRMLDWSPDGTAFAVSDKPPGDPLSIFHVDARTGVRRRLTEPAEANIGDTDPAFSPDGRSLAFVRMPSRFTFQLHIVPADGGQARRLGQDDERIGGVAWTARGEILYSSNRDGAFRLYRANPRSDSPPHPDLPNVAGDNPIHVTIARSSDRLAYLVSGEDLNIWRLRLLPKGELEWTRLIASTGIDAAPQYSPDGRSICFLSDRSGAEQIWIADASGSNPRPVTREHMLPGHCRWTADGSGVLFSAHASGKSGVYVAPVDGGAPRQISIEGGGSMPLETAEGKRLLVVRSVEGRFQLFETSPRGGPSRPLIPTGAHRAKIAPAGGDLYYVPDRTASTIWRFAPAGSTYLFDGLVPGYFGFWAPASRGIYFLSEDPSDERPLLSFFDFATRRKTAITPIPGPLPPLGLAELSLSPDERDLLMVRRESSSSDLVAFYGFQ